MKKILFFCCFLLMATVCMKVHAQATSCTYSIVMNDQYGDGWNDGTLQIRQGTTIVGTYTLDDGYTGTQTFTVQNGLSYSLYWNAGDYDDEVSFIIEDATGTAIYTVANAEMISGNFYTFTANCSDCVVGQLAVVSVNGDEATISWISSSANSYEVCYALASATMDETSAVTVTDTFYTFSNLTTSTSYVAYVRANCSTENSPWRQIAFSTTQVPAQLPYIFGFEDATENANWQFNQNGTNKWYIGSAASSEGTNGLYISQDNGTTNTYDTTSTSTAWAYRDIDFGTSAEYTLSFKYRNVGESASYDYLKVYIGTPTSDLPSGSYGGVTIPGVTLLDTYHGQSTWQDASFTLPSTYQGVQRLYFLWWNDTSDGDNPPAAVDNISIVGSDCVSPNTLALDSTTLNTVAFHFTPALETDNSWQAIILTGNDTIDESLAVDVYDTYYEFTDLNANTAYRIFVRTNCGSEYSAWSAVLNARTACASIDQLPYTENFDTYGVGTSIYPSCWSKINTYSSDRPYINTTNYSNPGGLYFYAGTTGTYNIAVMPEFDESISINTLQATFMYRSYYASDRLVVGVMTDPTDASTFVPVDTVSPINAQAWEEKIVEFTSYTGTGQFIAFRNAYTTTSGYAYMDDLMIDLAPDCSAPTSLTLNNLTGSSADLAWTDEDSQSWEVYVYAEGETVDFSNAEMVSSNVYSMQDLTGNTSYHAYVRAICTSGNGYSNWANINFMTPSSNLAQTPYFTDWSDAAENAEWNLLNGTQTNKWYIGIPTGGTDSVLFVSQNGTANTYSNSSSAVWAYRDIQFGDGAEFTLKIKWKCQGESSYDYMKIFLGLPVSVNSGEYTTPSGTTQLGTSTYMNLHGDWQYLSQTLSGSYANTTQRLYFLWRNDGTVSNPPAASIDTIEILVSDCGRPYNVTASNVAPFTADISFNPASANDNAWEYALVTGTANPNDATPVAVTDTVFSLDNLTSETAYVVYVRTDCGNGSYSEWSVATAFTTLISCPAPNQLSADNITTGSADIDWNEPGSATSWTIEYGPAGFAQGQGTTEIVTEHPYTLTGLVASTTYTVYVQSDCGNGDISAWSSALNFATACEGINVLPYTENFDAMSGSTTTSVSTNNLPACWQHIAGSYVSYAGYPIVYSSSTYAASGSNAMRFYTGTTTSLDYGDQYGIMPNIDVNTFPMNTLQVTFNARKNSTSYTAFYLIVGIMEGATASSFVPVDTLILTDATYDEYTVRFDNYTGTGDRIAFMAPHNTSVSYNTGYVDNIIIEEIPACSKPMSLAVVNSTSSDVTLQWTEAGDATEWEIEYGDHDFTNGTGTVVSAYTNPFTVSGLILGETYDFYVRSICSASEQSEWRGPISATPGSYNMPVTGWDTIYACGAVIYDDGGITGNYSNNCSGYMVVYPENAGEVVSVTGTINAESATYDYIVIYDGASASNEVYRSNQVTGTTVTFGPIVSSTGPLTIYFHSDVSTAYAGFEIHTSCVTCASVSGITATNVSTTSATINWNGVADGYNVVYGPAGFDIETEGSLLTSTTTSIDLTGLTALTSYDVYVQSDCGGGDVSEWTMATFATAACDVADQCTYTFVCSDEYGDGWNGAYVTVEQNGNVVATVEAINHYLDDVPTTDNIPVSLCDGISTTIVWHSGQYDIECGLTILAPDGSSVYSSMTSITGTTLATFTTNCSGAPVVTCDAPTNLSATGMTVNSVVLNWNQADASVNSWTINYKKSSDNTWTSVTANAHPYTLTGLEYNTVYDVKVAANCDGATSDYTAVVNFRTAGDGVEDYVLTNSINLYPNPATTTVTIQSANGMMKSVEVYDVYGKMLNMVEVNDAQVTMNIANYAAGTYFVRVNTESGMVTKRIVKR